MFTSATPVSVAELAQLLIARKKEGKRTLVFLGARAGGLFGNQAFYDDLQRYSFRKFSELSEIEKFHECYEILKNIIDKDALKDEETVDILEGLMSKWLKNVEERELYNYMAELVKGEFFDVMISTNMDSLLDDTFGTLGMRRSRDYSVVNMLATKSMQHMIGKKPYTIVKVFGELVPGNYKVITGKISRSGSQRLRTLLNSLQDRDMLAVGYDSLWDEQIESALLMKGELWYINEELPEHSPAIIDVLEHREGKYVVGIECERFFRELYNFIKSIEDPVKQLIPNPYNFIKSIEASVKQPTNDFKRRNVFISYSHKDKAFLDRLLVHLDMGYETDRLDVWSDKRLNGGEDWNKEIQEAIAKTKVAVFLVSADFIASKYIREQELPPLLKAASTKEVTLLSIVLYPCSISKTGLDQYHLMNNPLLPLGGMNKKEREKIWMNTARLIEELLFSDQ